VNLDILLPNFLLEFPGATCYNLTLAWKKEKPKTYIVLLLFESEERT